MIIEPKSIEQILEAANQELFGCVCNDGRASKLCGRCDNAIRSAIASAILHAAEAVKPGLDDYGYDMATPEGRLAAASHVASANAYYAALSTYAEKITKE